MVAKFFTWTLCVALFVGVCGFTIKKGHTRGQNHGGSSQPAVGNHGQNHGGSSQPAVGYDASKSGQQNPVNSVQSFMRFAPGFSPSSTDAKQVGSVASEQMHYMPSNANDNPAGSQQQGVGSNAQALSGSNTGAFSHGGAMYGVFPSSGPHASSVSSQFGGHATDYRGGDLITEDGAINYGNYKSETEEQGTMPQPQPAIFGVPGHTSQPRLQFGGYLPFYYDYRFLTGQYPRGTYTHTSISHSQGLNSWNDAHYVREAVPYAPVLDGPPQPHIDLAVFQNVEATGQQQNAGVYQGSATRQQVPHQEHVGQQGRHRVQTPGQFSGSGKV